MRDGRHGERDPGLPLGARRPAGDDPDERRDPARGRLHSAGGCRLPAHRSDADGRRADPLSGNDRRDLKRGAGSPEAALPQQASDETSRRSVS